MQSSVSALSSIHDNCAHLIKFLNNFSTSHQEYLNKHAIRNLMHSCELSTNAKVRYFFGELIWQYCAVCHRVMAAFTKCTGACFKLCFAHITFGAMEHKRRRLTHSEEEESSSSERAKSCGTRRPLGGDRHARPRSADEDEDEASSCLPAHLGKQLFESPIGFPASACAFDCDRKASRGLVPRVHQPERHSRPCKNRPIDILKRNLDAALDYQQIM
jgi:hypothetical protein